MDETVTSSNPLIHTVSQCVRLTDLQLLQLEFLPLQLQLLPSDLLLNAMTFLLRRHQRQSLMMLVNGCRCGCRPR